MTFPSLEEYEVVKKSGEPDWIELILIDRELHVRHNPPKGGPRTLSRHSRLQDEAALASYQFFLSKSKLLKRY